ncbi:hypothetical protein hp908_0274 [Helicobacter pylori 908]|nr:hypothetical protein hp908_0274 [Helicobacter pylori 908]ADZ49349.1 hypothetical protein hp2017_02681 [Helicobacter pylori 2017]ADZ50950.1 hypothetical protein hp2018_02711 [Helicobacter pylori 2018]
MFRLSLTDIILERFKDFMREYPEPYKFYRFFTRKKKNAF